MKLPVEATCQSYIYDRKTFNVCCLIIACCRLVLQYVCACFDLLALGVGGDVTGDEAAQMPQSRLLRVFICE